VDSCADEVPAAISTSSNSRAMPPPQLLLRLAGDADGAMIII